MSDFERAALLVVDVQKDFCAGGALEVPGGDRVVPVLNAFLRAYVLRGLPIYASRDWHPAVTMHFARYGGIWPVHCVAGSEGARFHPDLQLPPQTVVLTKGQQPSSHGYSAFEGVTLQGRTLLEDLRAHHVRRLVVGGLATDYCVRHSVLDARTAGLDVTLIGDAVAGVDLKPGDSRRAIAEMARVGVRLRRSEEILP